MHELRLVAVSEDGSYAVLAVPGRGGRFSLPIDDRLRAVARGQFSRLAQYEIEVESPLRPKEIQDRIRAGETADEIADAAGVPIERVRRFEGPVLAEREYRAQEAQRATVRSPGDSGPGPQLGDIVAGRLVELGATPDDAQWDSRKRPDGNWQVQITFVVGGRSQVAEWVFDPRRRHIAPDDDQAARLCLPAEDLAGLRFATRGPATATVTPIASRLGGAAPHHPEPRMAPPEPRLAPPEPRLTAPEPRLAPPEPHPSAHPSVHPSARPPISAAAPRPSAPAAPAATPAPPAAAAASAGLETDGERRPADPDAPAPDRRTGRPARKASGGRSRRASVPSWDEIMLGNSRQPD
jgi:hypothetical protein